MVAPASSKMLLRTPDPLPHTRLEHVHLEQAVVTCSAKAGHYYALMMDEHGGIIEADNTYRAIAMFQTTLG